MQQTVRRCEHGTTMSVRRDTSRPSGLVWHTPCLIESNQVSSDPCVVDLEIDTTTCVRPHLYPWHTVLGGTDRIAVRVDNDVLDRRFQVVGVDLASSASLTRSDIHRVIHTQELRHRMWSVGSDQIKE